MKRILIFSTAYYPFVGGAEVAVKEITDRLSGDFEFDVITAKMQQNLPSVEKIGTVTVYRVGMGSVLVDKLLMPFLGAIKVATLQKNRNYSGFWGIMATYASGAAYIYNIFRKLTGKKKIPMILTLQEGDSEAHLNYRWGGLISLSWKLALRQTDFLTAISNFLLQRGVKNGYRGSMELIPNGVDISVFSKEIEPELKEKLKNRLGKKEGDVFLVTSSRLVHKNAVDDVISALTNLPENVKFIVMGDGPDGPYLHKQVEKLKLSERVRFLGFVSQEEMAQYFSVCDVFVRPSRSEGMGNSFIEAMAAGLPVIATPVGGIPDFIDDRETGIFCEPNDPHSIADAVNLLVNHPELKNHIIEKAKGRVIERYSWEKVAKDMKERVLKILIE
jgi:glycosyltransferase involved in cell wall biosynthesis